MSREEAWGLCPGQRVARRKKSHVSKKEKTLHKGNIMVRKRERGVKTIHEARNQVGSSAE